MRFTSTDCTEQLGVGGPPKCLAAESEEEGTPVEVFPFSVCEGEYVRHGYDVGRLLEDLAAPGGEPGLVERAYAVYDLREHLLELRLVVAAVAASGVRRPGRVCGIWRVAGIPRTLPLISVQNSIRPALTTFPVCAESCGLRDKNADTSARTGFCHPTGQPSRSASSKALWLRGSWWSGGW